MEQRKIKAFEFAVGVVKQFLTIAIAIIAVTATFSATIINEFSLCSKLILVSSWIAYLMSIILGLFSLMKLTTIMEPEYGIKSPSIKGGIAAKAVLWQIILFGLGLILTFLFGVITLF